MAEIGGVSRFTHKSAITAFAGVDPGVNESGTYEQKSVPTSKRGSDVYKRPVHMNGKIGNDQQISVHSHHLLSDFSILADNHYSAGAWPVAQGWPKVSAGLPVSLLSLRAAMPLCHEP